MSKKLNSSSTIVRRVQEAIANLASNSKEIGNYSISSVDLFKDIMSSASASKFCAVLEKHNIVKHVGRKITYNVKRDANTGAPLKCYIPTEKDIKAFFEEMATMCRVHRHVVAEEVSSKSFDELLPDKTIKQATDEELVEELRSRGIIVSASKTVIINL